MKKNKVNNSAACGGATHVAMLNNNSPFLQSHFGGGALI